MIDLKECIRFCIENFDSEEATERLFNFFNDSLKIKEQEIELRNSIKAPKVLKELTIDDLKKTIKAIYGCEYSVCSDVMGKYIIYVDPNDLSKEEYYIIDRFKEKNNLFDFRFVARNVDNNCCNSFH